jgi:DNA-binding CsgD family transcriptional regulator
VGDVTVKEIGVLDGVTGDEILAQSPERDDPGLFAPLRNGTNVILRTDYIEKRVRRIVEGLGDSACDLIVIALTGLRTAITSRIPIINGQHAVDAWTAAFVTSELNIGLIYPLPQQGSILTNFDFCTRLQSAHATVAGGHSAQLSHAVDMVARADLIVMHSVGYTEEMAQRVARESRKPVVTARKIIAGAIRIRLAELEGRSLEAKQGALSGADILNLLPEVGALLTHREREVLTYVLEGGSNKLIGRSLGISHRTVEIHRSRAMGKLNVTSVTQLIRRALASPSR